MQIYKKNVLYVIAGANGSGKTTLAQEIANENPDIEFLNPDAIKDVSSRVAGRMVLTRMKQLFSTHDSFIYETTLAQNLDGETNFVRQAHDSGYKIIFVYVLLASLEQNIARVAQRVKMGGHDVPIKDIRRRYYRSLSNIDFVQARADQWEIYYNGGARYELIARGISDEKINVINNKQYRDFIKKRAEDLSENLLELGHSAAAKARIAAILAGVPIVDDTTIER